MIDAFKHLVSVVRSKSSIRTRYHFDLKFNTAIWTDFLEASDLINILGN